MTADAGGPPCLFSVAIGPARLHSAFGGIDAISLRTKLLLSILIAGLGMTPASKAAESSIEVSIAVPYRNGKRVLEYSARSHFHVIIFNKSGSPQKIWRDWCSWGYYALSFELTDESGKTWTAKKKPRGWRKNFPDSWTVAPHECLVLDVDFADAAVWEGFSRPSGISETLKMRAIFEIQTDKESEQHSVWTGRAVSKTDEYVFYR